MTNGDGGGAPGPVEGGQGSESSGGGGARAGLAGRAWSIDK